MGRKKYQNWQTKAGLLKLIQDMPIRYVHLMPFARVAAHRGKLPHQAVPCIFCRWMICAVRIPITNPFLAPFLSTIFLAVPPHHAFTSRLCWWMKLVVYLPIWNKRLLPHALTIHSVSLCDPAFMHSVALSIFKSLTLNGNAGKKARLRGEHRLPLPLVKSHEKARNNKEYQDMKDLSLPKKTFKPVTVIVQFRPRDETT